MSVAKAIINGQICAFCNVDFVYRKSDVTDFKFYEHGYPVLCVECNDSDSGYELRDKECIRIDLLIS